MLQAVNLRSIIALLLVALLLASNAVLGYLTLARQRQYEQDVAEASTISETIHSIHVALKDVERGQREYLFTSNEADFASYSEGLGALDELLARLTVLTAHDAAAAVRVRILRIQIAARLETLAERIETLRTEGFEAARQEVIAGTATAAMDSISHMIDAMAKEERAFMTERNAESQKALENAARSTALTTLGTFVVFVAGMVLLNKNIAARSLAARQLADQRNFLQATLRSTVEGIFVTDARGIVSYMNPTAESMAGIDESDARGLPIEEVMDLRDEHSGAPVESTASAALRAGELRVGTRDRVLIGKDGKSRAIEDTAELLRDDDGRLTGAVLAVRDVTATRASARRIKELLDAELETSDKLREIAEAAATLNAARSRETVVDVLTTEATRIFHAEETSVLFSEEEPSLEPGALCVALIGAEKLPIGHVLLRGANLSEKHFERDLALLTQLGRVACVAIENIRLYDELRARDRRKDQFLATLAHELRNPLAPLYTAVQILRTPGVDSDAVTLALAAIDRQLEVLIRLVDDLLDVSRITRGKILLKRQPTDVADVVGHALEMTRQAMTTSGHTIVLRMPSEGLVVDGDPVRLEQVLTNLLHNSAKYTDQSGHIWLSCSLDGDEVVISVRDDGMGIPPEMLDHIFDMFWQHEHALERAQGGLGIGLSLVRQIVDLHGGRIEARSAGVGLGSEFIVRLPRARDGAKGTSPARVEDSLVPKSSRAPMRVLVVDDNKDSAESLAILLRLRGHDVRIAHDGISALSAEEEFRPVLVLLDIGLPRKNGYDVAIELRTRRGNALSIVAMTGFGQPEDRQRSREAGFDHHMVKPIDPNAVFSILS